MILKILGSLPKAPARIIWNVFWWFLVIFLTTTTASLLYGIFYWLFIPIKAHEQPAYLQYRFNRDIPYAEALVDFTDGSFRQFLRSGQEYDIHLDLKVPENKHNLDLGNFMLTAALMHVPEPSSILNQTTSWNLHNELERTKYIRYHNRTLYQSSKPAILKQKSPWLRFAQTWTCMLGLLLDWSTESQTVQVQLMDTVVDSSNFPITHAWIQIHSKPNLESMVQVYACKIRIDAHFANLRYLMYYWFIPTAVIFILSLSVIQLLFILFIWFFFARRFIEDDVTDLYIPRVERIPGSRRPRKRRRETAPPITSFGFAGSTVRQHEAVATADRPRAIEPLLAPQDNESIDRAPTSDGEEEEGAVSESSSADTETIRTAIPLHQTGSSELGSTDLASTVSGTEDRYPLPVSHPHRSQEIPNELEEEPVQFDEDLEISSEEDSDMEPPLRHRRTFQSPPDE